MKIGVLTHNYPRFPGDFSGRFVEALSEELAAQGHDVTVIAPWDPAYAQRPGGGRAKLSLYRYAPREDWHRLGYMRTMRADVDVRRGTYLLAPGLFAAGARAIMTWTSRERPDVLHAHWALPNGFLAALAARRYGVPLVVSIPGSDATVAGKNPAFRWMARHAFDTAGLVTANAESLRDVAVRDLGADPARFELIPYGVDPGELRPDPSGTAELRRDLGIPSDAVILLAVGRMVYKKGFDSLLRATALLKEDPGLHLVMVGEGDLWGEWQTLGESLGLGERVHWVGNVPADRMSVYYNVGDVFVLPAANRPPTGLAVAVLDAMSCAKPVVGSNAAGNGLAIRDGLNGFLTPEGDDTALAEAIRVLVHDPALRGRMGAASRNLIDTELGWPQLARRYVTHFEQLGTAISERSV